MDHYQFLLPSFVVGVTGHIDPDLGGANRAEDMRATLKLIFEFLQYGAQAEAGWLYKEIKARLPRDEHAPGLDQWPGLGHTPLMVLTSLAPGADSIVAEVALQKHIAVRAPLPFPKDIYRNASTFVEDASKPTEEEKAAQAHFDDLVARIGDGNVFPVRMAEEISWDHERLERRMEEDSRDTVPRRRRYQAAAEYVASHCDLLLALWDDDYDSGNAEGTAAIVEVKLRGVTPELLPAGNSFTWANCGPVVHVNMRRRKNERPVEENKLGRVRWLHAAPLPKDLAEGANQAGPPSFLESLAATWRIQGAFWGANGRRWNDYKRWQISGNHLLCRIAKSLDGFNEIYQGADHSILPLCKLLDPEMAALPADLPPEGSLAFDLQAGATEFFDALAPLAAARRCASETSQTELRRRSLRALSFIFLLIFGFAVCLHLFSHWKPNGDGPGRETGGGGMNVKFWFGVASLALGAWSLGLFWWHRRSEVEERDQDYRALAEGLRVQIAWCMAGLYRSAAAHYLERQRNEMDWIRGALSSLSMPYHRWSRWFDGMEKGLQLRLLRWTQKNWLNAQARYHRAHAEKHAHNHHALHKLSGVFALCGVLLIIALVGEARWPFLNTERFGEIVGRVAPFGMKAGLVLICLFMILWFSKIIQAVRKSPHRNGSPWEALPRALRAFIDFCVPTWSPAVYQSPSVKHARMIVSFAAHLPLAALLSAGVVAYSVASRSDAGFLEPEELISISSGIFLLMGALLAGWTEKNLLSEQAYQFSAMASLFTAAQSRVEEFLREAEDAHARQDDDTRDTRIRQARQMLYDLGLEALDENAEWLILHRARPMEPMMPG